MAAPEIPTITLTPEEEKVRSLLVDVAASIDSTFNPSEKTVLRITGGWVRDKLLKGKSHDIDIGINNMTGFEFASHLSEFLKSNGGEEKYGIPARSIHKIESNPEKSKHLETATTKILGLDIDFVNLRSETYSEESRIPQMKFGTPKEDALRRDACVNALFYNLMTQEVEDFTERGLSDLQNRVLRTPLPPFETFKDDPLRVLRLIRFASRLSFTITPDVQKAMQDKRIKDALKQKISRERVGVETEKMLYGEHPYEALDIIEKLGLRECIFEAPMEDLQEKPIMNNFRIAIETVKWLFGDFGLLQGFNRLQATLRGVAKRDEYILWLLAATSPWGRVTSGTGVKKVFVAAAMAREGLKLSNKDYESLTAVVRYLEETKNTMPSLAGLKRSHLGNYIRRMKGEWRLQVLGSLVMELVNKRGGYFVNASGESEFKGLADLEIIKRYEDFVKRVEDEGLADSYDWKPLLTGKEIANTLECKPGPWMKKALEDVLTWHFDNPGATKEDALEHLDTIVAVEIRPFKRGKREMVHTKIGLLE